jgi:hypothetical protein
MTSNNKEQKQEIKEKKLKKLIFIFSDGHSGNPDVLKQAIDAWRKEGVYVYGIGIGVSSDISHYLTDDPNK